MTVLNWKRPRRIIGRTVVFRNAQLADSAFRLRLRTDELKSRHMSPTPNDLGAQRSYVRRYAESNEGTHSIVESFDGERIDTARLYDAVGDSFAWGNWIRKHGGLIAAAVESALVVYSYALDYQGFARAHCLVRPDSIRVWKFHERFGAQRVVDIGEQYKYHISPEEIRSSLQR